MLPLLRPEKSIGRRLSMSRIDVYESVTDRIVASLESGVVPWRTPWVGGGPVSIRSGKPYRGVNIFLLGLSPYGDPRWGTFKAIKEAGGHVRKGEKSTHVILWKPVSRQKEENGQALDSSYMLLRTYSVFNAEQADGLPEYKTEFEHEPIERAQMLVDGYEGGPGILFGGGEASYEPFKDLVRCPEMNQFRSVEGYYSTLYHELIHSTGHEKRLKRIERALFGTSPYAKEELVAEMGAAMLCGLAGIDNQDQSAAYVDGWLSALRNDRKLVVQAAAQAQKAADLILGTTFGELVEPQQQLVLA
jgi:antirestriction protein ArdC